MIMTYHLQPNVKAPTNYRHFGLRVVERRGYVENLSLTNGILEIQENGFIAKTNLDYLTLFWGGIKLLSFEKHGKNV